MSDIQLWHGDCLDLMKDIPDSSVDLIIADPPYVVTSQEWDTEVFTQEVVDELFRILKDTGSLYVRCGIGGKSQSLMRWYPLIVNRFYFKDLITWKKSRGIGMRKGWLYAREEVIWAVKNNKKFVWNKEYQYSDEPNQFTKGFSGHKCKSKFKRIPTVWTDIPEILGNKNIGHYTPKPLAAIERIILVHTQEGDLVVDPFMGSGTTGVVCKKLNRRFIGIEIEKEYLDTARERVGSV